MMRAGFFDFALLILVYLFFGCKSMEYIFKAIVSDCHFVQIKTDLDEKILGMPDFPGSPQLKEFLSQEGKTYKGAALMNGGLTMPWIMGHYPAFQIYFRKV